jgi:hypothetical protein
MRLLRLLLLTSLITAAVAGVGVALALPFGGRAQFIAGTVAGTLGVLLAIRAVIHLGWFDVERRRGGSIGGMVGLALASPLVAMTPTSAVAIAGASLLVGVCVLFGSGPGAAR